MCNDAELQLKVATDIDLPKSSQLLHNQRVQSPDLALTKHLPQELKLM